ncbi:MAG: hypothetical protein WCI56_13190 [Hyphomicrobiales bacterium]
MSGRLLLLLPVFLLSWSSAGAQTTLPAANAVSYKTWIGKFPSDRIGGKTFLEQADVQRRVKTTLGANALRQMQQMRASEKIREHRNWLLASGCQQHMCPYAQWTVAINLVSGETWACVADLNSGFFEYGSTNGKPVRVKRKLEDEGCPYNEKISERFDSLFSPAR